MVKRILPLLLLVGCASSATEPTLTDTQLLIRASLDLRGVRPSVAELDRIEDDPDALPELVEEYLQDPRFGDRMRALYTPVLRTRIDAFPVDAQEYGLEDDAAFQAAVGEEVPRMVGRVARDDLPFTELVVGDWTMAEGILEQVWPVQRDAGEGEWRPARYTDGRPAAGILATNSLWWRYPSNGVNFNRGRANALSRILLCNDYLAREVDFPRDVDLTDGALVDDALRNNPGCVNCHVSLDPIGSYLFGFQYPANAEAADASIYHPERERGWQATTGVAPGWYGEPGYSLSDLGRQIAADPRFVDCAVETVFEGLVSRDVGLDDADALSQHREAFLAGGATLRPLVRSILSDPAWLGDAAERNAAVRKIATPDLLASQIEDLTGYRLTVNGVELMETDRFGLRSLAGGVDGATGTAPARTPTPTMVLVQERLAEGAAFHVATADAASPPGSGRRLFQVDFADSSPATLAAEVARLHRRLFGTRVENDDPEVAEAVDLFATLLDLEGDPVRAWAGVLTALLRDPDLLLY